MTDAAVLAGHAKPKGKARGIFEKPKGSNLWWVRYADAAGRERREKAGTKGMALTLYRKRKVEAAERRKQPERLRSKAITVGELLDMAAAHVRAHYKTQRISAKTGEAMTDYRCLHLAAALGSRPAESVTPQEIERALAKLAAERNWKPASSNRHKAFLSLAYRLGMVNGLVNVNPARLVQRKPEGDGRVRWLDAAEEVRLRAVIERDYPAELPGFLLSIHTGMRQGEQYGLTWDCVDFERRQLTIRRPKHGAVRYIPLDATALNALLALRDRGDGTGRVMVAGVNGHGKLAGEALKTPKQWFGATCRKAGVADYTWHSNRHTTASRLVQSGVPLKVVQEIMGHRTIQTTLRYAHLAPGQALDAIMALDDWGRDGASRPTPTGTTTGTRSFEAPTAGPDGKQQTVVQ